MKKTKNKSVKKKLAIKKGNKKVARKKVAKNHLEQKKDRIEALKKKEEKAWEEHYSSLLGQ